jgi:mannose/fructose/N-acetylgalactosamine-specific phosphotransferase system component IID
MSDEVFDEVFDNEPNRVVSGVGTSIVRTLVPVVVGSILAALASVGLDLPEGLVTEVVAAVIITLYYAAVRLLEENFSPAWGWLLGVAKVPQYNETGSVTDYDTH